jgi:peptidoglycan-N-acetylglucosamine deacetylase
MEDIEYSWKTILLILLVLLNCSGIVGAEVIAKLPTHDNTIALTFDACETSTPSYLDQGILTYLLNEQIPFTLFVSGKFLERNKAELTELSRHSTVEIENHSLNHRQHMEKLSDEIVRKEVLENEKLILAATGRAPVFFRFPGGNYNPRTLRNVELLGYKVVHWTFPSGDPDRTISAGKLAAWVLSKAKPGSILIFHINGRGYRTAEALPRIVEQLRSEGYHFVTLEELIEPAPRLTAPVALPAVNE